MDHLLYTTHRLHEDWEMHRSDKVVPYVSILMLEFHTFSSKFTDEFSKTAANTLDVKTYLIFAFFCTTLAFVLLAWLNAAYKS